MAFKENLRQLRIERGFTSRRSFAINTLEIEYTTYNNYESGTLPPEELIIKIAQVLNVSIDELFGYDPTTKKRDIDIVVKELNDMGIKAVQDDDGKEVSIFINKINRFTVIPYDKIIEIVKSAHSFFLLKTVNRHIIYSIILQSILRFAGSMAKDKRKIKSRKIDRSSPTAANDFFDTVTNMRPYTKKEKNAVKHSFEDIKD